MPKPLLLVVDYGNGRPEFDHATEEDLAQLLMQEQYGADFQLHGVYAMGADAKPVEVTYTVEGARDFDHDSWAHATVTVFMPDGSKLLAGYTIDGRA